MCVLKSGAGEVPASLIMCELPSLIIVPPSATPIITHTHTEPAPDVHACCVANVAAHRAWALRRQEQAGAQAAAAPAEVEVLQKGCGDGTVDSLTLVSYDNLSAVNTVVPDHEDAVHILKSFLEAQISEGKPVGNKLQRAVIAGGWRLYHNALTGPVVRFAIERYARMMLAARREVVCEMTTVSDVMRERGIE